MRVLAVSSLLLAFLGTAFGEEVVTLTTANFQETIDKNQFTLVEFYAPWCGHCKKLAPEYEEAAVAMKGSDPKVVIAKVDATAETELATKFGVKGFPTLKWFVNGKESDYTGGRTKDTIVSWIQKKTGPPAKVLRTVEDLKTFQDSAEAVAVGFFKDEAEAKSYLKHAQTDDDTPYAVCYGDCAKLVEHTGAETSAKLVILQKFDAGKAVFDGDHTQVSDIANFVSGNVLPLVIPFSQQTAPKIFNGAVKDQLLFFVDAQDSSATKAMVEKISPVAEQFKGRMIFVTVQKSDSRILDFFGVKEADIPTARIVNMGAGGARKFKYTESEITPAAIAKFAEDYFAGNVQIDLKSEEPLPESEQGNVRVVVGKDFEQVISQPGKDVLIEFYAPWCGHCKKLEPEYNALGDHYKDNENLIIAKMDATANEVEKVQISGFPTLKFFPADSDEIVDYDGERTQEGMKKFLEKNAKSLK